MVLDTCNYVQKIDNHILFWLLSWVVFVSVFLPEESTSCFINWTVEEVYKLTPADFPDPVGSIPQFCYTTQKADANRIKLFNTLILTDKATENILVCQRKVDFYFIEKHYFTTYQSFITRNACAYWQNVVLANQSGSIFDTLPA